MHTSPVFLLAGAATVSALASNASKGFTNPTITPSSGGNAICVTGNVPVYAATKNNVKINLAIPANQTVVTETVVEMLAAGSTFMQTAVGGKQNVSGTYTINAQICYPTAATKAGTVQVLTHGVGFDKSYWDVAPGYSYIDVAAANGYTTFSYDRLGTGASDRPDAHQVVQAPFELSILHSLIQSLRNGTFGPVSYSRVIGVGHSFGSALTQGITNNYPRDLDAAVLTGFSTSQAGVATFTTALDLTIAQFNDYIRFSGLSNGYLVANNYIGNQFAFFKAQGFPPENLAIAEASKQTVTFAELATLASVIAPATNFTGPVDVVNGANDWPFCMGNCTVPMDLAAAVKGQLYPKASNGSSSYLAPNAGHGLNLHYAAGAAYNHIQNFVKTNGF